MDKNIKHQGKVKESLFLNIPLTEARRHLEQLSPQKRLEWAVKQFGSKLAITTSFGIQSSVLLHMIHELNDSNIIKIIWVDTGYLPAETYKYAETLSNQLKLDITVVQSNLSPARMEALYGKLWEKQSIKDLEKYHDIRKVQPLEDAFKKYQIDCWASGVRRGQTENRKAMSTLDPIRERLSLRPILEWSQKDIFYYMEQNNLPQHPLFEKGFSSVGDWHSSAPDTDEITGRKTRFGGLKQECGIHITNTNEEETKSDVK
ncbi:MULTISPECIES: phosphoadenylyl-sulfate reductase [unclassified Prochlorococcus]|uniref:phosphoadenylyl-sulfate reductase n=1 Tax=unclassified Prochlorococcus TaxID=2627481 RepID=UPI000533B7E6|nr:MULTISPECIES: phosphoadenylyl-sulfate reductase [unclassified Prochlorococcus]KGG16860.1 Phosphoadenylyl-sulfate reductase (thioredoxin) [Prochlorococcus sp. MIT 0602]KGG18166.1 Phosphoadenylyl-sulfate reductase (thioredoxin) [Prochlorococcus sp. MIT 0603]